jgi:predicted MFS family arabinose efflux permease
VQTAAICGAPVGGLLAEQFGTRSVFAAAAGLSLLALAVLRLDRPAPHRAGGLGPDGGGEPARLLPLLRQRRLLLPLFGAAVPVKLVLAGFLFYLVPVALRLEGYSPAAIGRAMMLYFVLVAACNPLASALSDRFGWQRGLVILGGAVVACVGLAGLAEGLIGGPAALFAGIAALGLGTGLSAAALQALVARDGPGAVVLLRTVERGGAVVGPLLAGSLLALWAYGGVMVAIGAVMFTATAVFVLAGGREGGRS